MDRMEVTQRHLPLKPLDGGWALAGQCPGEGGSGGGGPDHRRVWPSISCTKIAGLQLLRPCISEPGDAHMWGLKRGCWTEEGLKCEWAHGARMAEAQGERGG